MDISDIIELVLNFIDIIVCLAIVFFTVPRIRADKPDAVPIALFVFSLISLMLSDIYWVVFPLIRPDVRMPIAANELGEMAAFLLMSTAIKEGYKGSVAPVKKEVICTIVFVIAQAALWIAWTGEWIQDIFSGAAFGYMMCVSVWALKQANVMANNMWKALGLSSFAAVLFNALFFYVGAEMQPYMLGIANIALLAWLILFTANGISTIKNKANPRVQIAWVFAIYVWSICTMWMSEGTVYKIAFTFSIFVKIMMFIAIRNEVREL